MPVYLPTILGHTGQARETHKTLLAKNTMALEMHLFRNQQKDAEWHGHFGAGGKAKRLHVEDGSPLLKREEIGFWQEANQIHGWFVDNVQKGEDDRQEYYVSRTQLGNLLASVQEVLDNSALVLKKQSEGRFWYDTLINSEDEGYVIENPSTAKEYLPTREGFFFGSLDYDQQYLDQLRHTRDILREALLSPKDAVFSYRANW